MDDKTLIETVEVTSVGGTATRTSSLSWSAVIAGAFAATVVTFIITSLGTGIGFSVASPYGNGPSVTTLSITGAVWLVFAQAIGFACGGYLAARLRLHVNDSFGTETRFRDGAEGFVVWALGSVLTIGLLTYGATSLLGGAAQTVGQVMGGATTGAASSSRESGSASNNATTQYFVDMLFRQPPSAAGGQTPGNPTPITDATRGEVAAIVARSISEGQLSNDDRTYLAQLVSQRTGLSPSEAEARVTSVENKALDAAKQAADKASKAAAYLSFWTFMALLFGAVAATLAGVVGGDLRDQEMRRAGSLSPAE
jgi:hypothetical protein